MVHKVGKLACQACGMCKEEDGKLVAALGVQKEGRSVFRMPLPVPVQALVRATWKDCIK